MRKQLIKSVKYSIVFILVLFNFGFLQLYPKTPSKEKQVMYGYTTGNESIGYIIEVYYLNKDSVNFLLTICGGKVENNISMNLTGKVAENQSFKVLTDECSKTEYPVNCYTVENDSCSFELHISIWNDRVFFIDKKKYFKSKYPQYEINFIKTFRIRVPIDLYKE
jgi:hypothetical protein